MARAEHYCLDLTCSTGSSAGYVPEKRSSGMRTLMWPNKWLCFRGTIPPVPLKVTAAVAVEPAGQDVPLYTIHPPTTVGLRLVAPDAPTRS